MRSTSQIIRSLPSRCLTPSSLDPPELSFLPRKAPIRDATRIFLPEILTVRRAARRLSICLPETWGSLTVRFGFPVRERGSDPGTRAFDEDLCGDAELAIGEEEGVAHNLRQGAGAASRRLHRAE